MMSLNQRILFSATLIIIIFIAGIALTLERAFYDSARLGVQDRLFAKLLILMGDAEVEESGNLDVPTNLLDNELGHVNSDIYALIINHHNMIAWRSTSSFNKPIPVVSLLMKGHKHFAQILVESELYFIYSYGVAWETPSSEYPLTFVVLTDAALFEAQIDRYREELWKWLSVMAILLLITQVGALHWGLRPLRTVSVELAVIESGQQENLKDNYPRELRPLTDSINSLINHEHKQQKRYRNGLADLAHSLKTPLAVLKGAVNSKGDEQSKRKIIHEQIDRMDNIIQYQLRRASTLGSSPGIGLIALRPMVDRIIGTIEKVYLDKHPQVTIEIDDTISLRIGEGDLMELLGNLIDNAFKWCCRRILISAECYENQAVIQIKDDGPGIQSHKISRILERGVRADQSIPGHGIGLAIVRDIIQVYGGKLEIKNNPNIGTCVILYLRGIKQCLKG